MGKYIIAVLSPKETGKTTVVNNVWDLLPCFDPEEKVILNERKHHEIIGFVDPFGMKSGGKDNSRIESHPIYRPYRIGVNSLGDTIDQVKEGLAVLIHHDCDIIVCAVRTEIKEKYGNDFEYMLREALTNIQTTKLHSNHLDFRYENDRLPRGITEEDLPEIASKISEYTVITCGHFRLFDFDHMSLTKSKGEDKKPEIVRLNGCEGLNLDRISAQYIVDFIERLS